MLVHTPPAARGAKLDIPAAMVDLAPTILALAGGSATPAMDGISFASQLRGPAAVASWPRDAVLIEYQSLEGGPGDGFTCDSRTRRDEWNDAYGERDTLASATHWRNTSACVLRGHGGVQPGALFCECA